MISNVIYVTCGIQKPPKIQFFYTHIQYSEWTVEPHSSATCLSVFMQFCVAAPASSAYWSENALTGWDNGPTFVMRHAWTLA